MNLPRGFGGDGRISEFREGLDFLRLSIRQALTPETEDSTHYFFAHCHNFSIDDPAVTESIHQSTLKAFHEDKAMIEAQHRSLALAGSLQPMAIQADAAIYRFRKVLQQKLSQEAESR